MKKKIILLALLGATSSLMALGAEHAYLYKDPRIMGMGGANIAVGSYSSSVFSNPAGLANIKKENGFVVDILSIGLSASSGIVGFVDDIDKADTDAQVTDVLQKHAGEHFHIGVDNYMSISKNSDAFAWSIGLLSAVDVNLQAHPNGSSNGGLLATSSRAYGGAVIGIAKPYSTPLGRLDVGLSLKYVTQNSYEGSLGISELVNSNDVGDTLQNRYEKTSSGYGVDIGMTLHLFKDSYWHPALGVSVLNMGDMSMDENYGKQPMSLNVGLSLSPEVSFLDKFVIAIDYVDALNANETRVYNYNQSSDTISYTDYEESDINKRVRAGVGIGLIDSMFFSTTLNGGFYQGAYTAGVELSFLILKLNVSTYQEQVGTGSVAIDDRRYIAQIGIGW